MSIAPTVSSSLDTTRHIHVRDPHLRLAMGVVWLVVVLMVVMVVIIVLPRDYQSFLGAGQSNPTVGSALRELGLSPQFFVTVMSAARWFAILAYLAGAAIIFFYRSDNWMAWLTSLALILLSILPNGISLTLALIRPDLGWLSGVLLYLGLIVTVIFLFVFPDGQFVPRWIKWLLVPYFLVELFRIYQGFFVSDPSLANAGFVWNLPLIGVVVIGLAARVYRNRHSSAVQRQQTKWVGFGLTLLTLFFILDFLPPFFDDRPTLAVLVGLIIHPLLNLSGVVLVVCMGIAITRYRLWDMSIIINRSLVYGAVTILLALVFLGGGFFLQGIVGQANAGIAFAISIVGAGLLFNPARKWVQHFIDRRFYGFRFDLNQLAAAQELPEVKNPGALTGRMLGPYQVLGVLGKGGMGEVYQGKGNGQTVAIKILPDELAQQETFRKRFEREAQTLALLDHPNIVKMYGSGESDGVYFIALEFIAGEELKAIIQRRGSIPLDEIRPFANDFASALDYAHARSLVHRDIKPSNVMLRQQAQGDALKAVLMDFGIAKLNDALTELTGTGAIGTIDYMAPEQIMAAREVDYRADIYALGVVLYEMVTGERPFKGSAGQVLFAHLQQPVPDPRVIVEDLPELVAMAILRALAKKPEDRFQSAGEFVAALVG